MSRRFQHNTMSTGFAYGSPKASNGGNRERPYTCADGHVHASDDEARRCIDAHKVYVCATNHMHTTQTDAERCDMIKREDLHAQEKEAERIHQRGMMDRQIKFASELRTMGYNFQKQGYSNTSSMPQLTWKD